ncbi:hypothetical protein KUTeg_024659 [Tegillarca granosa]|uniref:Poly [ADP-ribose] polymerase n=1 Tax=Tegillarca granosa TaxID=220873 RepID=A0ABQ9DY12_TEGGR|nr:hypothetical protein KUTeg_024659 [Tegillarca granosa]
MEVDKKTYKAIVNLFKATWGMFSPNVVNVQRIENVYLYGKYKLECQRLFRKAAVEGGIVPIKKTKGSSGSVVTKKHLHKSLSAHLYPEINEHYFFHGTDVDNVDVIVSQGFDCRLARGGRVGSGIYGAERSAKSNTYVDSNSNGESKMFLLRMCLGDVYVTKENVEYSRPPCKQCDREVCYNHTECYDSVIADGGDRQRICCL